MRNTQTPRTDAAETNWWSEDGLRSAFIVRAEFARELEREMEQLRKERDEARAERDEAQDERRHAVAALSEQVDTLRQERAEMQRMVCRALYTDPLMQRNHAKVCGWRCFDVTERQQPDATTDKTSREAT